MSMAWNGSSTKNGGYAVDPRTGQPITSVGGTQQPSTPSIVPGPEANGGDKAVDTYTQDLGTAGSIAEELLQGKEHATIADPYEQQRQEYVKYLQGRLGGLDSGEQRAMKEEGLAQLDQQTAQNLERYGSIAGANGVQGGARAGLMGKALHENNLGRAQLERQFVMDNIAIKDKAAQAYGGAMNDASNIALGVGKYNAGAHDADIAALLGTQFDIMSGIGANRSEIKADDFTQQSINIARAAATPPPATTPTSPSSGPTTATGYSTQTVAPPAEYTNRLNTLGAETGKYVESGNWDEVNSRLQQAVETIMEQAKVGRVGNPSQLISEWMWNAGLTSSATNGNQLRDKTSGKVPTMNELLAPYQQELQDKLNGG